MNREVLYAALFAKLSGVSGLKTVSRKLKGWDEVAPTEQPALFQNQRSQTVTQNARGTGYRYDLPVDVYIYVHSTDPHIPPASLLNPLIDAVETAIAPPLTTGVQDLGFPGIVSRAFVSGRIETDEGVLGEQAVAIIPIMIVASG